jgi:hypothetical protein
MAERFCPGCGAPLAGDVCAYCGTSFAGADAPAPEGQQCDPLLDPTSGPDEDGSGHGGAETEMQALEAAFAKLQQARRDAPDDAAFWPRGAPLAAEFSQAAAAR